jgi:hypothetical protein
MDHRQWTLQQLSAATLLEAIYWCIKHHPENPCVNFAIKEGIPDVVVLNMMVPKDARLYIVHESNKLIGFGAVTSLIEKIQGARDIRKAWREYRDKEILKGSKDALANPDLEDEEELVSPLVSKLADLEKKNWLTRAVRRSRKPAATAHSAWIMNAYEGFISSCAGYERVKLIGDKFEALGSTSRFFRYCGDHCETTLNVWTTRTSSSCSTT